MGIETIKAPAEAQNVLRGALAGLAAKSAFRLESLRAAKPHAMSLSTPHRVAYLAVEDIRRGAELRSVTQPKGLRFLVHEGDDVIAAAEVMRTADGGYRFTQLNDGPFVAATVQAIRVAEKLDAVREGRFEPWLLTAPAVNAVALWLQATGDDGGSLLIPLPPANAFLKAYEPVTERVFLDALQRLAANVPRSDSFRGG